MTSRCLRFVEGVGNFVHTSLEECLQGNVRLAVLFEPYEHLARGDTWYHTTRYMVICRSATKCYRRDYSDILNYMCKRTCRYICDTRSNIYRDAWYSDVTIVALVAHMQTDITYDVVRDFKRFLSADACAIIGV